MHAKTLTLKLDINLTMLNTQLLGKEGFLFLCYCLLFHGWEENLAVGYWSRIKEVEDHVAVILATISMGTP
jgi:hypothetical protein